MRPSSRGMALAVVLVYELAAACAVSPVAVNSTVPASGCRGVSISVYFHPQADSADFPPVLSALRKARGVLEIGFLSKQQALEEDVKEFGGAGLSFTLADAPPSYQVIVQGLGDARRIKADLVTLHGVDAVVVGPDINRPFVAASLTPVGVADTGLFYVGTVISKHCPS